MNILVRNAAAFISSWGR